LGTGFTGKFTIADYPSSTYAEQDETAEDVTPRGALSDGPALLCGGRRPPGDPSLPAPQAKQQINLEQPSYCGGGTSPVRQDQSGLQDSWMPPGSL